MTDHDHAHCNHDHAHDHVHTHQEPYVAPERVGRNDPCPCGSGKKFKKCCLA